MINIRRRVCMFYSLENVCTYAIHVQTSKKKDAEQVAFKLLDDFLLWSGAVAMGGESTCIFACLQCERSICLENSPPFSTISTLHALGIKVVKWISVRRSHKKQQQHFDFTIKVTQSFCFSILPGVLFSLSLVHFWLWNLNFGIRRKKNLITAISLVCAWMKRVHDVLYCETYSLFVAHTPILALAHETNNENKKKTRRGFVYSN